jgi:O-methyltransferase involved in polyketide biosynthesis
MLRIRQSNFYYVMNKKKEIELGSVQETLLLPLWGRAIETQKQNPLLVDWTAVSIVNELDYDFGRISKKVSKLSLQSWISRCIYFDSKIHEFMDLYPDSTIVNIGCGLDTTFDRIDNGRIHWIDLDLPDAISLRRIFIKESDRRRFVDKSVFDVSWYNSIAESGKVMLLMAGVIYYFDEKRVQQLFMDFHKYIPDSEVIFDYSSSKGVELANKNVIDKGGMDKNAYLQWGCNDIHDLEKWGDYIKVLSDIPMFADHKKHFPMRKRIGMIISDKIRVMSLTHIKID